MKPKNAITQTSFIINATTILQFEHSIFVQRIKCCVDKLKPPALTGIDEETLEVWAVEVTGSNIGDAPMLPELLNQIPSNQDIGSVTAGGAYDTRKCHEGIAARDAHAVVPPRKNAKPWKPTNAGAISRKDVCVMAFLGFTI